MYTSDNAVAVEIRRGHINHEASVRSVGILYYAGATLFGLAGVAAVLGSRENPLVGLFMIAVSALYFLVGRWFRTLNPRAKVMGTILAVIGLLGIPIGTLINGYILYLMHSEKGKVVFSEQYQAVIAATPEVRYRTSIVIWILLGIVVLFIVLAMVAALTR